LDLDEPLASMLLWYAPGEDAQAKLDFTEAIFLDLLPQTPRLIQLKSHMVSDLHMGEVFTANEEDASRVIRSHLWPGIRNNPAWLLNRGVIAILFKQVFANSRGNGDR
jgi:hypothetical protein